MHEHNGGGAGGNGLFKHLARMDQERIEGAVGNLRHADQTASRVEQKDLEGFDAA
jgi:hypothetical protein